MSIAQWDNYMFDQASNIPCNRCIHNLLDGTCVAFPGGLPAAVVGGFDPHLIPLAEQENDVVFEYRDTPFGIRTSGSTDQ